MRIGGAGTCQWELELAEMYANVGAIYRRARLGGMLNFYCRKAA